MSSDTTNNMQDSIIVADVGGTNGRFSVADFSAGEIRLSDSKVFSNSNLASFGDLLAMYLNELGDDAPRRACFATAGPNDGRRGLLTNLGWRLDASALEAQFGLEDILFVNDFMALARMAPELPEAGSHGLTHPGMQPDGPITVIGPGTGLGVAMTLRQAGGTFTIACEGGHMTYAPSNTLEGKLRDYLAADHEHVFTELLLSGQGLCRIHDFLVAETGSGTAGLGPAEITDAALAGESSETHTVQTFLSILGSVAGDVALCHGAVGGVYLGGGIVKRILPLMENSELCARFCAKTDMEDYMSGIPIRVITADQVARRGAALLYREREHLSPNS